MDTNYIGEWLLLGNLGHLLTIVSMMAAFLATASFVMATRCENTNLQESISWKKIGRISFLINFLAIVGIFIVLFVLIFYHRFEYKYVWQHSSLTLPVHYMISCFWEGQEGSFLLWQFWTAFLGLVLIAKAKKWEAPVMSVFSFTQIFLAAMLIGIYFFGYKIGSSPFVLLRNEMGNAPIFARADYLNFVKDGNGLNPLLQNYWMVIHPPTLFLGFAASLVPFAYVIAALWKQDFKEWVAPTLSWSLFAGGVLGTGILMGGAWAYEALSFGGFWAWDPVENASLVPWIVLLAGIHTLVAYKHSGHALKATAILLPLSFLLVLYSTFLTRSGILGDTSVHSFTDLGMSGQLLTFMLAFVFLTIGLLIYSWNKMPSPKKEEDLSSREFWMFIGSIIMLMLSALITVDTSWPVINKILGTNTVITEPVTHYNRYTLWFGVVIAALTALIQYLRYKKSSVQKFAQKLVLATILAAVISVAVAYFQEIFHLGYFLLLFTAIYTIIANLNYLLVVLSGKVKIAGGSVAHVGFGLMLVGILLSCGKQEVISLNTLGIDYGEDFDEENKRENVLLYKDKAIQMNEYWVTYVGDSVAEPNTYYKVKYELKENEKDLAKEEFTLFPNAQINPNMGLIANPDTRHYWTKDIFTHVSSVRDKAKQNEISEDFKEISLAVGDTAITSGSFVILKGINPNPTSLTYTPQQGDVAAGATLEIIDILGKKYSAEPIYYIRDNIENFVDAEVDEVNMSIKFQKILPKEGKVQLGLIERNEPAEFIIMKAIVFPYINVLWLGCFVMVIGFFISMRHRVVQGRRGK